MIKTAEDEQESKSVAAVAYSSLAHSTSGYLSSLSPPPGFLGSSHSSCAPDISSTTTIQLSRPSPPVDQPSQQQQPSHSVLLGFSTEWLDARPQFKTKVLIAGVILVYLLFYVLQELIFKRNKFNEAGFVTFVHFCMFWAFAMWERHHTTTTVADSSTATSYQQQQQQRRRKAPWSYHIMVGFFCVAGFALGTYSSIFLNFPTWLMFKSSRVVATMIGGVFILGKRYSWLESSGVGLIFFGLIVFTLGDVNLSSSATTTTTTTAVEAAAIESKTLLGILLVCLALTANAAQDNLQEKGLRQYGASENEIVVYSYGVGIVMLLPWLLVSGEFTRGMLFIMAKPMTGVQIIVAGLLAYMGVVFVLALLNQTSALVAVITTSCRKALSIVLSFLLFKKPFVIYYVFGAFFVFAGVALNFIGKQSLKSNKSRSSSPSSSSSSSHQLPLYSKPPSSS